MYFSHPSIRTPTRDQVLWRYLDVAKLADLLVTKSLYFPTLAQLSDPWEGTLPDTDAADMNSFRVEHRDELSSSQEGRWVLEHPARQRERAFVSYWHANEVESHAMWRLYLDGHGVAVRTTVGRLIDAADGWRGGRVYIGWVDYVNLVEGRLSDLLFPGALLTKDVSYQHEKEVRALVLGELIVQDDRPTFEPVRVAVSPTQLLECVVPSPTSPDWVVRIIQWLLEASACPIPLQESRFKRTARL